MRFDSYPAFGPRAIHRLHPTSEGQQICFCGANSLYHGSPEYAKVPMRMPVHLTTSDNLVTCKNCLDMMYTGKGFKVYRRKR